MAQLGKDRFLDLYFPGPAIPGHRRLNFRGIILGNPQTGLGRGQEYDAPRLAEAQSALDVMGHKGFFKTQDVGSPAVNHRHKLFIDETQAFGQGAEAFDRDDIAGTKGQRPARLLNDTPSGPQRARVYPQHAQWSLSVARVDSLFLPSLGRTESFHLLFSNFDIRGNGLDIVKLLEGVEQT